ncbi:hypothetical protein SVIOM74S_05005 [Streptomyces violarus]
MQIAARAASSEASTWSRSSKARSSTVRYRVRVPSTLPRAISGTAM